MLVGTSTSRTTIIVFLLSLLIVPVSTFSIIFGKIRPYKQRQEGRFETVEFKNYEESETNNNDQQNEHTIIVPDTQDVPTQIKENGSNFLRDNFFLQGQGATKAKQRKN